MESAEVKVSLSVLRSKGTAKKQVLGLVGVARVG